jgi:hypothetical protein
MEIDAVKYSQKNCPYLDFTVNTTLIVSFSNLDILYDNAA